MGYDVSRFVVGDEWVYRLRDDSASERVRILAVVPKKSSARLDVVFLDDPDGRVENVPGSRLPVLWSEVEAYDVLTANWARLDEVKLDDVESSCASHVFEVLIAEDIAAIGWSQVDDATSIHAATKLEEIIGVSVADIVACVESFTLNEAIVVSPAGTVLIAEVDGTEFGAGKAEIFTYGPDARRLLAVMEPELRAFPNRPALASSGSASPTTRPRPRNASSSERGRPHPFFGKGGVFWDRGPNIRASKFGSHFASPANARIACSAAAGAKDTLSRSVPSSSAFASRRGLPAKSRTQIWLPVSSLTGIRNSGSGMSITGRWPIFSHLLFVTKLSTVGTSRIGTSSCISPIRKTPSSRAPGGLG
jgi:hypothetical protein